MAPATPSTVVVATDADAAVADAKGKPNEANQPPPPPLRLFDSAGGAGDGGAEGGREMC